MSKFKLIETGKKVGVNKEKTEVNVNIYYITDKGERISINLYEFDEIANMYSGLENWNLPKSWMRCFLYREENIKPAKKAVEFMNSLLEMDDIEVPNFKIETSNPLWRYKTREFRIYRSYADKISILFKNRLGRVEMGKFADLVNDIKNEELYGNDPLIEHYEEEL